MKKEKVNIVIPAVWTGIYLNTARLLRFSLEDLGKDASIKEAGQVLDGDWYIVVGWNLIPESISFKQPYILYQLEPLILPLWQKKLQEKKQLFRRARDIWDYSPANQEYLEIMGYSSRTVVMGYHPKLFNTRSSEYADYDVLFTGFLTERRKQILEVLQKHCLVSVQPRWGRDYLDALGRSKLVLNLHQYDSTTPLEQPRISYALNNKAMIISETSLDSPYEKLISCDYNQIVETVMEYLHRPDKRNKIKDHCFEKFSSLSMESVLAGALEPISESKGIKMVSL